MDKKANKYETKIEKLTFFRVLIVFICEFVFEFSFGLVFYIFTENEEYYGRSCEVLLYWSRYLWKIYFIEFAIAFVCFLIGIFSLFCHKKLLTKVYVGFNNTFKSMIFVASLIVLSFITVIYSKNERCHKLGQLTFVWLVFHYILLTVACVACCTIIVVTAIIYKRSRKKEVDRRASLLQVGVSV